VGTWGARAFDNDTANDWAYELDGVDDLSPVEAAFDTVERGGYLEQGDASEALAACEVLARLQGRPGYSDAYTKKVDDWVAAHRIVPPAGLIARANGAIDRVLGEESELRELWAESGEQEDWLAAVEDLRARLGVP
jgi:hypothetical protein